MKHAGSQDELLARLDPKAAGVPLRQGVADLAKRQSGLSWIGAFACALLMVAVVADAPVRTFARSLDPSVAAVLRRVTQFGNSAWSLAICLLLFVVVARVARRPHPFPPKALQTLRSALLLVIGSVAVSGMIASLAKNMIGRARPSHGDAQVFEFALMSFRAAWAAFPSGHATTATACAVALAMVFPRQALAWLALGLTTAFSRAFLGVHWLSDCLAGIALGAAVSLALARWMKNRGHAIEVEPGLVRRVLAACATDCLRGVISLGRKAVRAVAEGVGRGVPRL